jgi:hypothetical protein
MPSADRRISSPAGIGTVVTHPEELNVVVAQAALGLKTIVPSGTA